MRAGASSIAFAYALPRIRKRVARDLSLPRLERAKVLATVVQLLERTCIRIGNDEYARQNGSFGLTTLRNGHAKVNAPLSTSSKGQSTERRPEHAYNRHTPPKAIPFQCALLSLP